MELIDPTTKYTVKDQEIIQDAIQTHKRWDTISKPLNPSEETQYFGIHLYNRSWFSCPNKVWIYISKDWFNYEDIKINCDWLNLNEFENRAYQIFDCFSPCDKLKDILTQYLKDWKMAKNQLQRVNNQLENQFSMGSSQLCELEYSRQRYQYMVNTINYLIYKCLVKTKTNDVNKYISFVNEYKEENGASCK